MGIGYDTPDRVLIDRKDLNKLKIVSYSDGDGTVNYSNSAYPPCNVDEEDIINIKKVHNNLYFDFDENDMPHSVETKYVSGKAPIHPKGKRRSYHSAWLIHIVVQTDDLFKLENIYADAEANHEGDTLIIHYDPDNPDNYCIGERADEYRTSGIFSYAMGGFFFVLGLLTAIFLYRLSKGTQTQEA